MEFAATKTNYFKYGIVTIIFLVIVGAIYMFWTTIKGFFSTIGSVGNFLSSNTSSQDSNSVPNVKAGNWVTMTANPQNPLSPAYSFGSEPGESDVQSFYDAFQKDIFPTVWESLNPDNWLTFDATIISLFESVPSQDYLAKIDEMLINNKDGDLLTFLGGHLSPNILDSIATIINSKPVTA